MTRNRGFISSGRALTLLAILFLLSPRAAPADPEGVRVLYGCEGGDRPAWAESLAAALARSELLDAVLQVPAGKDTVEYAARLSCVLAVRVVSNLPEGRDASSDWAVVDPLTQATLASGRIEGSAPSDRELAEYWWIPVVQAAEAALPKVRRTLVRVEGKAGTVIEGLAGNEVVIPEAGFLDLPLRVPGTYPWRAVSAGAYPERGYFAALEQGLILTIPNHPLRLWTVEAGLAMMEFPDFWIGRRFREDSLFLRFGVSQYLLGVYLTDEEEDESVFLSLPLILPGCGFGRYFLPSDAPLRPYASATVFARILLEEVYWGFDPIAPLGLTCSAGIEWKAFHRAAVFLELGATLYPFCQGFLLASSPGANTGGPFGAVYGSNWLIEAPAMRFGTRFTL